MDADDIWKRESELAAEGFRRGNSQRESTVADVLGLGGGKWASDHQSPQHLAV
jgi:hypothetical protein